MKVKFVKFFIKIVFLSISTSLFATPLTLSPEEQHIIQTHPIKCISTGLWAPFNTLKDGKLEGIGFDYLDLISKKLHLKTHCKQAKSWTEVLTAIKTKTADLTVAGQPTQERKAYAVFSKPYATYPIVVATRNNVGYIDDIHFLDDKIIAIGKSYAMASLIKKHYPYLKVKYVETLDDALHLIETGKAFATIEILPVLSYKINNKGYSTLKISGSIPYSYGVTMMLRKDYATLIPLINKAIESITVDEKSNISKNWMYIHHNTPSSKNLYIVLLVLGVVVCILAVWLFGLYRKIKHKNETEKSLKKMVYYDFLTSVYNRHMLDISFEREIALSMRSEQPMSIIFLDIDRFKKINDTYGHKKGDSILKTVAEIVSSYIRTDDIFGRWGGDEFLLILPQTPLVEAKKISKELYQIIKSHDFGIENRLTCSFGVATYEEGDTVSTMIVRADNLLYAHKSRIK